MRCFLYALFSCILICSYCKSEQSATPAPTEDTFIALSKAVKEAIQDSVALPLALAQYRDALKASEHAQPGRYDSLLAAQCHDLGSVMFDANYPLESRAFYTEALRLRKRLFHDNLSHKDLLRTYCMLGKTYNEPQEMDARLALSYFVDSTRQFPWNQTNAGPHIFALSGAAQVYLSINELALAKTYFQAAYDSVRAYENPLGRPILSELHKFYASCSRRLRQFDLAIRLCNEGIVYAQGNNLKLGDFEMLLGNIWQDSMSQCTQKSLRDQARERASAHIFQALTLYKSLGTPEAKKRAVREVGNLGALYYRSKKYDQAAQLLSNALNDTSFTGVSKEEFAHIRINLGDTYRDMGNLEAGISQYREAIKCLIPAGKKGALTDFQIEDLPDLLYTYGAIANAQLRQYHALHDTEILPQVMASFDSLVKLTNLTRSERLTEQNKFDLAEKSQEALSNAVGVCNQLYQITSKEIYKTKAFSFAEQSKGFALLEAVRLRQLGAANPNQKQRQQSALREIPIQELQRQYLAADQGLVSYFAQDTLLHLFLIKSDTLIWKQCSLHQDSLSGWVQRFQALLQDPEQSTLPNPAKEKACATLSHQLYQWLLAPLDNHLPPRLVIVPCAPFLGLPFEALSEKPFAGSLEEQILHDNLVLFKHSISYAVSANIWAEMQSAKTVPALERKVAAFAPAFNLTSDPSALAGILAPMHNTPIELQRLGEKVPAVVFLDSVATKSTFKEASRKFNVIHLASHSICDDRNPDQSLLAFYQPGPTVDTSQLLYLRELYNMNLQQDLIVLSACETSRGEYALGEGNLSIARGLAYGGAHSFISTLWVINTEPGITIMPLFYQYLQENLPKDVALAQAKRAYIKESPRNYAPLKWAGIVLNGSTQPVQFSDPDHWSRKIGWLAGLFALLGIVLAWRKYQRK
jgi:CHAT domain-containing protein